MIDDPVPAALRNAAVLESLGIDYWLGRSRQWRDVLGVLKTTREMDRGPLDRWAKDLDVVDLLERALQEAGIDPHNDP